MIYLLYNPKSNHGKPYKIASRLEKKWQKKEKTSKIDLISLQGKEKEFVMDKKAEDWLVLFGGDGTIDHFLNAVYPVVFPCRVFVRSCGRGNDLARDYKKHHLFEITHLCHRLPKITIDHQTRVFINGVGMGVDSLVCAKQLSNAQMQIRQSYFSVALGIFKTFRPYALDIEVDGQAFHYNHVWFFVCNHGCYFGGGMKITPKAKREDDFLDICIVHDIRLFHLLCIFPLVFIGKHIWFCKKSITMLRGQKITVTPIGCTVLQRDGEISQNVHQILMER